MREWLSGRASPCQGERREFESRLPLHFTKVTKVAFVIRRHSQVVRQRPAKPLSPVQVWVAPPRRSKVRFAPFFFAEKHPPAALLLLFRKRSRQVAWLTCKRVCSRFVAYQPFSGCAFGASAPKPFGFLKKKRAASPNSRPVYG